MISIVGLFVGSAFCILCYLGTNNILISAIILILTILYFLLLLSPIFKKYQKKISSFHQCYTFINNYIISLSIKGTVQAAFDASVSTLNDEYKDLIDSLDNVSLKDKLYYLRKEFCFHVYSLFLNIVSLWEEEGGDIIKMSHHLINQVREVEEYINACEQIQKKKMSEFIGLWAFALAVIVFLRFSLSQFFSYIVVLPLYQIAIFGVFIFVLVSIHLFFRKYTFIQIEGGKNYEK